MLDEFYTLPVFASLRPHYLLSLANPSEPSRTKYLFAVRTKVMSSLYTNDPFLHKFFRACHGLMAPTAGTLAINGTVQPSPKSKPGTAVTKAPTPGVKPASGGGAVVAPTTAGPTHGRTRSASKVFTSPLIFPHRAMAALPGAIAQADNKGQGARIHGHNLPPLLTYQRRLRAEREQNRDDKSSGPGWGSSGKLNTASDGTELSVSESSVLEDPDGGDSPTTGTPRNMASPIAAAHAPPSEPRERESSIRLQQILKKQLQVISNPDRCVHVGCGCSCDGGHVVYIQSRRCPVCSRVVGQLHANRLACCILRNPPPEAPPEAMPRRCWAWHSSRSHPR